MHRDATSGAMDAFDAANIDVMSAKTVLQGMVSGHSNGTFNNAPQILGWV
jgi:hypothetical protein